MILGVMFRPQSEYPGPFLYICSVVEDTGCRHKMWVKDFRPPGIFRIRTECENSLPKGLNLVLPEVFLQRLVRMSV